MKQARPKTSVTERLRDENPAQWQEYLALERAYCTPFGESVPPSQYHSGKAKLDALNTFFAVESSRVKFGMSLKDIALQPGVRK